MTDQLAPVVAFRGVSKTYGRGTGRCRALDEVTRRHPARRVHGRDGAVRLRQVDVHEPGAGLDDPTSGEVWVAGHALHQMDDDARTLLRREHVGFVFQAFNLVRR